MKNGLKKTKIEYYKQIKKIIRENNDISNRGELILFINNEIENVTKRNSRQKKYSEKMRIVDVETDPLYEEILGIITEDFQSIDDIMNKIDKEKFSHTSRNKVTYRLNKLVDTGNIEKKPITVNGGNRFMHYRLI